MTDALRARPVLARGVSLANKVITDAVYVAYPCLLVWLVTVLRKVINAPRPYEVFDASPVIPKDTRGNSFPSRHAFSIFVIAMTFCACCPLAWVGPVMLVVGVLLAVIRVVSGVHFPRDVVVGALLGMLAGFMGLWIL